MKQHCEIQWKAQKYHSRFTCLYQASNQSLHATNKIYVLNITAKVFPACLSLWPPQNNIRLFPAPHEKPDSSPFSTFSCNICKKLSISEACSRGLSKCFVSKLFQHVSHTILIHFPSWFRWQALHITKVYATSSVKLDGFIILAANEVICCHRKINSLFMKIWSDLKHKCLMSCRVTDHLNCGHYNRKNFTAMFTFSVGCLKKIHSIWYLVYLITINEEVQCCYGNRNRVFWLWSYVSFWY